MLGGGLLTQAVSIEEEDTWVISKGFRNQHCFVLMLTPTPGRGPRL